MKFFKECLAPLLFWAIAFSLFILIAPYCTICDRKLHGSNACLERVVALEQKLAEEKAEAKLWFEGLEPDEE